MNSNKPRRAGALKQIFQFALLLIFLSSFIIISPVQNTEARSKESAPLPDSSGDAPLFAAGEMANVSVSAPADVILGNDVSFSVTFDNDSAIVGYGPFLEVVLDTTGIDGTLSPASTFDGLSTNATITTTYLGNPINPSDVIVRSFDASGNATHPYARDSSGNFITVTAATYGAAPGDKIIFIRLPFGSFTPAQPPATVNMTINMSNFADVDAGLFVKARGGYQFGTTPLDDFCCGDLPANTIGSIDSDTVTPRLYTLSKAYTGPENETATGPNFPRTYTLTADIATGQTITNLVLTDVLPSNIQFISITAPTPAYTSATLPSTSTPGGTIGLTYNSIAGTAAINDIQVTVNFYVPLLYDDADVDLLFNNPVIDPLSGDDVTSSNSVSATGGWLPLDTRDRISGPSTPIPATGICPVGCPHTLTDKSIAIQKLISGTAGPGQILTYTLDFQISDFFAFDGVTITDVISDGQRLDTTFTPTLFFNGNTNNFSLGSFAAANYDVTCHYTVSVGAGTGAECEGPNTPTNGTTDLVFRVSDQIGGNGRLIGGCVNPAGGLIPSCTVGDGPTTGQIVFRTVIQERFANDFPSADPSVDQGDILSNSVTISGNVLDYNNSFAPVGTEEDISTVSTTVPTGSLTKSIYAVNGSTSLASPVKVKPGDTVTYRLTYVMPISDEENLEFTDYLPLPVFHVGDPDENGTSGPAWVFDAVGQFGSGAVIPASGHANFGQLDTFYSYSGLAPALTPTATDIAQNRLVFTYGDYDNTADQSRTVDILFSAKVSTDPFADNLYLTNEAHAYEGSTNGGLVQADAIVQLILTEPVLTSTKGVIWTSNPDNVFTPATRGPVTFQSPASAPRWTGTINSNGLAANPIDSNVRDVDAGDKVTFAITIENSGSSLKGAFDIQIKDILQPQYDIPLPADGGLNFQVYYGNGTGPIPYRAIDGSCTVDPGLNNSTCGAEIFDQGIELIDPVGQGVCQAHDPNLGNNVIVITYDLRIKTGVEPGNIINTETLLRYAGDEGGPNHVPTPSPLTDQATVTISGAPVKYFVTTSESSTPDTGSGTDVDPLLVTIGEIIRYRLVVRIPESTSTNFQVRDLLPNGLTFLEPDAGNPSINPVNIGIVSDSGIGSTTIDSVPAIPGACNTLDTTHVPPTATVPASLPCSLADFNIGSTLSTTTDPDIYNSGTNIYFKLGNLINADSDDDGEFVIIEFNVRVHNEAISPDPNNDQNDAGDIRDNRVQAWAGSTLTQIGNDSPILRAQIVESSITFGKVIVTPLPSPLDAGAVVQYKITYSNSNAAGTSTAFDVNITDTLPTQLSLNLPSIAVTLAGGAAGENHSSSSGNNLIVTINSVPAGGSVTIDYTATIMDTVTPAQIIANNSNSTWTSLPGAGSSNSTGSTAGPSGSITGERNGSGGLNDYIDTSNANFTIPVSHSITKQITATSYPQTTGSDVIVGEEITYALLLTFPEGTTPTDTVLDDLPSGLEVVPGTSEVITTNALSDGLLTADFSGSMDTPTITEVPGDGGSVTFVFTTVVVPGDDNITNNTLMMRFRARVTSDANNIPDRTISNAATNTVGQTVTTSNSVVVTLRDLMKSLIDSNITSTSPNEVVTIGEIVTYQITLTLPPNTTDTAIITDTLDSGLAFIDCLEIDRSDSLVTSSLVSFTGPGNCSPVITNSDTNPINEGNIVTFDLGNIANGSSETQTITLTYRVIVLDVDANVQGVSLDNNVVVTNSGGTVSTQGIPSLRIVEPKLHITKTVDPEVTEINTFVTFTIDVSHTDASLATAYDVLVTDGIPTSLALVPGSILVTETGSPLGQYISEGTTQFSVYWREFPLGATARITFRAKFVGPDAATNTANVEWSSLQLDPVPPLPRAPTFVPQSDYNDFSTERRYNPLNPTGIDNYRVTASARIGFPPRLPRTGFAPGKITMLPEQPDDFAYFALSDLWLEIPKLGVKEDIVGVPYDVKDWNLTWLGRQAGYLSGSAYPTHNGNSAITAHAYLADGTPGPFAKLNTLSYGDQVIVHLGGQKYIFEVRENLRVRPDNTSILKHEEKPWLTLITCQNYDEGTKDYIYRIAVRAVLVKVE
jgi:large repetitive protein